MPTTPVSPERRIVLTDVNRRGLLLPMKFSDEVIDFEIDWTQVNSGDPVSEVEVTAKQIVVEGNSTDDNVTRIRVSGGEPVMAVLDLLAITGDGERIGARLKLPVTFRASAPGPVTRLLSGSLTASGAFAGLLTNAAPGTVSLSGQMAGSGAFAGALSLTVTRALTGALMASSSLTGSLTVSEVNVVSLVGTVAASGALTGALSNIKQIALQGAINGSGDLAGTLTNQGETIGGVPIGADGTGVLSGYRLMAGDDFGGDLDIITPAKPFGTYGSTRAYLLPTNANGPRGAVGGLSLKGYDTDPFHTGHNDKNRGVAPASWADSMVQQDGILKMKVRTASTQERALFNPDLNVNNIAAMIHTAGSLIWKPPFHIEFRAKLTKAQLAVGGYHPSFWLMQMDPPRSGNGLEIDWEGESDLIESNYFEWNNGNSAGSKNGYIDTVYDDQFHTFGIEITSTHYRWYYDGVLFREQADTLDWPNKPFYALVTSHVTNFGSDPYNDGNWVSAGATGATIELDYIRLWQPPGAVKREPLLPPTEYEAASGASFSFTLPTATEVWGSAINERVEAFISESNSPGGNYNGGFSGWPSGITYNATTRVLSGSSTQPGTLHIVRYPLESGHAYPQRLALHIGPKLTISSLPDGQVGQAYSYDLYAAVDAGQLTSNALGQKAKTIAVTGLPAGLSYSDTTGLITGTPTTATTATVAVTGTNSRGQSISANLGLTVAAEPVGYVDTFPVTSGLILDLNPDDPSKVTASGGLVDAVAPSHGTSYSATSTGSARPSLVTSGGDTFLRFAGAQELIVDPTFAALFGSTTPYSIVVVGLVNATTTQYFMDIGKPGSTSSVERFSLLNISGNGATHRRGPASGSPQDTYHAMTASVPHVMIASAAAGNVFGGMVVDGTAGITSGGLVQLAGGYTTATVGNRKSSSGNSYLNGDVFRVAVFNRVLTTQEMADIRTWAQGKYGAI